MKSKPKTKKDQKKVQKNQQIIQYDSIKLIQSQDNKKSKILLTVGAKPNSKQSKISQINNQFIGINIGAPPKQGQANQQLISHISYVLNVKKNFVYLDKGAKSKHKVLVIENNQLTENDVLNKLNADMNS